MVYFCENSLECGTFTLLHGFPRIQCVCVVRKWWQTCGHTKNIANAMRECKWMGRRSRQWSAPNQEYKQRNTHNIWVDVERGQERMGRWNQIQFHLKHVNVLLSQRASRWHAITFPDMRVACMCVAVDIRYMHVKVPQTFSSRVKRCIAKKKKK